MCSEEVREGTYFWWIAVGFAAFCPAAPSPVWHYVLGFLSCLQYYYVCEILSLFTLHRSYVVLLCTQGERRLKDYCFKVFDSISKLIIWPSYIYLYHLPWPLLGLLVCLFFLPLFSNEAPGISTKFCISMGIHDRLWPELWSSRCSE